MKRLLLSLSLLTCMLGGAIGPLKTTAAQTPCAGSDGTQAEANACARAEYRQADAKLNQVYGQLMSALAGYSVGRKEQQKLRQAQTLWLQYRDANCESEAAIYEGGSIRPAVYYLCLASVTAERTKRLQAFLAVTQE